MNRRRSEASWWVSVATLRINAGDTNEHSVRQFETLHAITRAFEKVGRSVRLRTDGNMLVLKARR